MKQERPWDVVCPFVDITEPLKKRFARHLKADIVSVHIVQPRDGVWLEITRETDIAHGRIEHGIDWRDLGIIHRNGIEFFDPDHSVYVNADRFTWELDAQEIIMNTNLFHDRAIEEISWEFNRNRKGA